MEQAKARGSSHGHLLKEGPATPPTRYARSPDGQVVKTVNNNAKSSSKMKIHINIQKKLLKLLTRKYYGYIREI